MKDIIFIALMAAWVTLGILTRNINQGRLHAELLQSEILDRDETIRYLREQISIKEGQLADCTTTEMSR